MYLIKQNSTNYPIVFFMPDATDPWQGKTGLTTINCSYRRRGDTNFTAITNPTITEIGNGCYQLTPPDACWSVLGQVLFLFTATGAKNQLLSVQVVGFDPDANLQIVAGYATGQSPADYVLATPANKLGTDVSGRVTVGTNADKTGYELSATERTNIASAVWSAATRTLTDATNIASAVWSATTRTLTDASNIASAVWGAASRTLTGLGTALVDEIWNRLRSGTTRPAGSFGDYLDANISSRQPSGAVTVGGYSAGNSPAEQVLATPANKLGTDASGRVTVGTNADKTGYELSATERSNIASAVWGYVLEATRSAAWFMRIMLSGIAGLVSGAQLNQPRFRDLGNTKDRITMTVDDDGNRISVILDGD